jgi:alpha-glucoside transport system permease protein
VIDRVPQVAAALVLPVAALLGYIVVAEWLLHRLPEGARPRLRPWIWIGPALAFVGFFLIAPAIQTIVLRLMNATSTSFVGGDNYVKVLTDPSVHTAIRNNVLWWIVFFTSFVLINGLVIAVLADRVRYEGIAKSLIFLPQTISFVAAGTIWKFIYSYQPPWVEQTGTLNAIVVGFGGEPQPWLTQAPTNNLLLILVAVWAWCGFATVILSAALKGVPVELLEAARLDGASEARVFREIVFPLLLPTITVVATTLVIFALKAFDVVYVMTNGNFDTEVLANRMYKEMFTVRDYGRASAVATLLLFGIVPVLVFNLRRFRQQEAIR